MLTQVNTSTAAVAHDLILVQIFVYRQNINVIIFGADKSSFVHTDNKSKDILIPTQGLDDTTLTEEAKYPTNFTQSGKIFILSLDYNQSNSFLFVNATKICQFKVKEIKDYTLCFGNISKHLAINNMKKITIKRNGKNFFCWF